MQSPDDIPIGGRGAYEVPEDDLPIRGGTYVLPEGEVEGDAPLAARGTYKLPDEAFAEEEEKEETGPLEKRIVSKNWKSRSKAYEELTGILKADLAGPYSEYSSALSKYIADANPGAQEKALDLLKVYILNQPDMLQSQIEGLVKVLLEKGMASAKPSIKSDSSIIVLDLFATQRESFEGFTAGLISGLNNKNIKVQAAAISAVNSIIAAFGIKKLSFKPFVGIIEKFAGVSNPQVRGEALNFYKESYRWVKDLIKPNVEKLKKPQQDELQKAFEEITEAPVPTRWLRHEEEQGKIEAEGAGKAGKAIDIYELADAKDIFMKYGERWCNKVLEMEKWQEKKQALEELNKEADYPKLAEKSAVEIVTLAKRLINDSNVQVMLQTMKLVGLLAKGQRRYFENYARGFLPILLQKFKDKKTQVIQETHSALDNLMFSLTLEQALEHFREALEDKTPSVKTSTCQLLERLFDTKDIAETRTVAKPIALIMKKNTDDSTPDVRQCSFKMLACLIKKCPDIVEPVIKDFPQPKLKKLEEASGGSEDPASGGLAKAQTEPAAKSKVESKEKPKVETRPSTAAKKEPTKPAPTAPAVKTAAPAAVEEDVSNAISAEEAENIVTGFLPADVLAQLKDNAWKQKQEGLQRLSEWIEENKETVDSQNEPILRFVRSTVKDWKENNFNVVKAAIEIFKNISENYTISKRAAASVLNATALEKMADAKLLEVYNGCISSICNAVGPKFVVGLIVKNTADSNKPKVVSECCVTIGRLIVDYGVHSVNLKEVVDYAKSGLAQANPAIKKASQSLTVIIYSYIGDKLTPLLTEIKEATMKVLQEEFSKTEIIQNPTFKSYKGAEAPSSKAIDPRKMLDDVLPRANIEKQLTSALMKKFADTNWKVRKEGLDEIESILDSNGMRILPTGLEDLIKAIVGRISDPNKSLVRQSLLLTGKLSAALGLESKTFARQMLPAIIGCLADKQNLLRADAMTAINKWAEEAGVDIVILHASGPLCIENPELRSELLGWLIDHKEKFKELDMRPYVQGTLSCLQDKSAPIRTKAEALFSEVVECVGFESFQPLLKDIKPAVMNTLTPIFEKYKHRPEHSMNESVSVPARTSRLQKDPPVRSNSKESQKSQGMSARLSSESDLKLPPKKPETRSKTQASFEISINPPANKPKRLEIEAKCKWAVEEIRKDYQEKLKELMRTCFSSDLFTLLYHADFKKQVEGVGHITNLICTHIREIIEVLDMIFRWSWIRLQEVTNTQLLKGIFEMLELLVNTLSKEGYFLHEVEASLFLPIMCEKSGQNNNQFKSLVRIIIHDSAKIYAPDKVFLFVLAGCGSKNTKSKVECLEELAELVKEYGVEICASKDIKNIAKHASSADNNVRTAAVSTMGELYKLTGDKIWSMIGEIPDKVKSLFDQRFKAVSGVSLSTSKRGSKDSISRIATPKNKSLGTSFEGSRSNTPILPKEDPEPKEPVHRASHPHDTHKTMPPLPSHRVLSPPPEEEKADKKKSEKVIMTSPNIQDISEEPMSRPRLEEKKILSESEITNESLLYENIRLQNEKMLGNSIKFDESQSEIDRHVLVLRNGDMSGRVDALVAINDIIINNLEVNKEELQRKANNLADALTTVIIVTFDKPITEIPLRFAKYFLNVVHKVCCTKIIMRELSEFSLFGLAEQVLTRLLIEELEKLGEKGEGESMLKTLNGTMLRILEHCRPTRIIVVLIRLLTKYKSGNSLQKMTGLIIRCLLKLAKIMASLIHQIEVDKLLLAMHEYLIGSSSAAADDVGSKTIKTILTELVKLQGAAIWQAYEEVKKHAIPDVQIDKWINLMLSSSSYAVNSVVSPRSRAADPVLTEVFSVIKQEYKSGFDQLAAYLEKHPNTELKFYLSTLTEDLSKKVTEDLAAKKQSKAGEEAPEQDGYNLEDFQKRLSMLKEKFGIAPSRNQPGETTTALNQLVGRANNILNRPEEADNTGVVRSRIQSFRNK